MSATGIVFAIQRFSVHDGPGIRTLVFLKGCPLRCRWCSNPESQRMVPELAVKVADCLGLDQCDRCVSACPTGALVAGEDGRVRVDRARCDDCLRCVDLCPARALIRYGEPRTVAEVVDAVEADGVFYARSRGGMTLGGGEPMAQPEFAVALLEEARRRHLNTAMETCGHCAWDDLERACRHLDALLFDLKVADPEVHRAWTGVSNDRIVGNLRRARRSFPDLPIHVRTPVVPGVNDDEALIGEIREVLDGVPDVTWELLPYHRLGRPKYGYLDRECLVDDEPLDPEVLARLSRG